MKVGEKDDLISLRAERNRRVDRIFRPDNMPYIDVTIRENRRRKDDSSDSSAIDEVPERRVPLIAAFASKDAARGRKDDEKEGQVQERDEGEDPVPREGRARD